MQLSSFSNKWLASAMTLIAFRTSILFILLWSSLTLIACQETSNIKTSQPSLNEGEDSLLINENNEMTAYAELFSGCYTVTKEEPAQIKVGQQANGLVMQMREPQISNQVWDDAEPLEILPISQVPNYFSVESDKVTSMIGRPDKLFVIAHIQSAYVNINPLLDSEYLGFIFKGANTIFKVECDYVHSDDSRP